MESREDLIKKIEQLSNQVYAGYEPDKSLSMLNWYATKYDLLNDAITKRNQLIYRGEIYWCELGENVGCEEVKLRPCVIIQNQKGNENSPTTIVAPITNSKIKLPVAYELNRGANPEVTGTIDLGQARVISKGRLKAKICSLTRSELREVDMCILRSLGVYRFYKDNESNKDKVKKLSNELSDLKKLLKQIREELNVSDDKDIIEKIKK